MILPKAFTVSVTTLPGIGVKTAAALSGLGIRTLSDLLFHFPSSYQDRRKPVPLAQAGGLGRVYVRAKVVGQSRVRFRRGGSLLKITIEGGGRAELLCFNRPFLSDVLVSGTELALFASFSRKGVFLQSGDFEYEVVTEKDDGLAYGRIVPVYPLVRGVGQRLLRGAIYPLLAQLVGIPEVLPGYLSAARRLMPLGEMIAALHFPAALHVPQIARANMAYIEFFIFQSRLLLRRRARRQIRKSRRYTEDDIVGLAEGSFGFRLTPGQKSALEAILADLTAPPPMQRLLMGDVGSGKTAVAAAAVLAVVRSGFQAALVAPTVVLAHQLFSRFTEYLAPFGVGVVFLSGKTPVAERRATEAGLAAGAFQVVVGTHLLFGESVSFAHLGLVVVDEQHRFGVAQRLSLQKKGRAVDYLAMSATPIPRSLALTVYGDLDVSGIPGLPPGRKPVKTMIEKEGGGRVHSCLEAALGRGEQALVVFPLIEASEKHDIAAAEDGFAEISSGPLSGYGVALLHGRMDEQEKLSVMEGFRKGEFGVLVATTIVEVGVDNPRASLIIIRSAERFGLAQLHQLRGRVGRGAAPGSCILVPTPGVDGEATERLAVLMRERDGFRIAEEDLRLRGQGDLFGRLQAGAAVFHLADPGQDGALIEAAREDALRILERDPSLQEPDHRELAALLFLEERGAECD